MTMSQHFGIVVIFVGLLWHQCYSLAPIPKPHSHHITHHNDDVMNPYRRVPASNVMKAFDCDDANFCPSGVLHRRHVVAASIQALVVFAALPISNNKHLYALAVDEKARMGSSPKEPIVVLGGGGKVGKICTQILASEGLYVRSTTRSGRQVLDDQSSFVSYAPCDVRSDESLNEALKGASGVIFAASASGKKGGGEPKDVDYVGAYRTAKACLQQKVPKLVLISAGSATRPDSAGFKAINFFVKVRLCNFQKCFLKVS